MRRIVIAACIVVAACDSGKPTAKPAAVAPKGEPAPRAAAGSAAASRRPAAAGSAITPPLAKPTAAAEPPTAAPPEGRDAPPRDVGPVGAGTGRDIESLFPELLEPSEEFNEARKDRIVKELRKQRGVALVLRHIIETPETSAGQDLYALYQYRYYADCAQGGRDCPPPEEVALNPDCRGYGIVHAHFAAGAAPDGGEPSLAVMPLSEAACDLQVQHWFVARVDGDTTLDAYLEIVSSQVVSKEPGGKKPKVTTEHRQQLYLWHGAAGGDGADAEPSFFLELARWNLERWRQREPPVHESLILFRGLDREESSRGGLDLIHLLPCLDPQSDEACDPELRRRTIHSWGASVD